VNAQNYVAAPACLAGDLAAPRITVGAMPDETFGLALDGLRNRTIKECDFDLLRVLRIDRIEPHNDRFLADRCDR
jgi:hypothetical protein